MEQFDISPRPTLPLKSKGHQRGLLSPASGQDPFKNRAESGGAGYTGPNNNEPANQYGRDADSATEGLVGIRFVHRLLLRFRIHEKRGKCNPIFR